MVSAYFVDTSALAKRYITEVGSQWVKGWVRPSANNEIIIAELTRVEVLSVFARHHRQGTLSANSVSRIRNTFLKHYRSQYFVMPVNQPVWSTAAKLVDKYPLRTLDAIQMACAVYARDVFEEPITFVSADTNLLNAAAAEGFQTDNPLSHP